MLSVCSRTMDTRNDRKHYHSVQCILYYFSNFEVPINPRGQYQWCRIELARVLCFIPHSRIKYYKWFLDDKGTRSACEKKNDKPLHIRIWPNGTRALWTNWQYTFKYHQVVKNRLKSLWNSKLCATKHCI